MNLVGELVINQAMLSQSVQEAELPPNSSVATGLDERPRRLAKVVRLRTEGEATEFDKTAIELLAEPLTHMIRNAVDQGLETPEAREAAGKPREGLVTLGASHRSGRVVIEVADDGKGIDRERVLAKAVDKGLVPADANPSEAEIDQLLFMPGFSTASAISNLSGRGVGMDVVKTAISSLGGRIAIASEKGRGTTFSISLPLTLAVLDGMVVRLETETLVVPLTNIVETLTLSNDDIRALGPETQVVKVRDSFLPLFDLGVELGYRDPRTDYSGAIVLLVAGEDGGRSAVVVDSIEDQRQVVIKGLHQSYGYVPGVAAATILGDGQIALILGPLDLVGRASGRSRAGGDPVPLAG